jgi:hypothetical protein
MCARGLYFASFWIASVVAIFRLKYLKETVESTNNLDLSPSKIPRLIIDAYRNIFNMLGEIPRNLYNLSFLVSGGVFFASLTSAFWIVRANVIIGLTVTQWGIVMLVSGFVSVFSGIPAGSVVDRFSKKKIAGICLIFGAIALARNTRR